MNTVVLTWIALIGMSSADDNSTASYPEDRIPLDDLEAIKRDVNIINEARRSVAKQYSIANMNELEYDYAMAALSDFLSFRCPEKKRLLTYKQYQIVPVLQNNYFSSPGSAAELATLATAHLTNPGQTRIGFGKNAKTECGSKAEYNKIFALGHGITVDIKHGEPGSQCGDRVNRDGLCVTA